MSSTFVTVQVEEHDELPAGCFLRFRAQSAPRPVAQVRYESEAGTGGDRWRVEGRAADGTSTPATGYDVDDSSAGTSLLVIGGDHGLRLTSVATGEVVAEAYLLLSLGSDVTDPS